MLHLTQESDKPWGDFDDTQAFTGVVDELRVWNAIRSDAEIAASYRAGISGTPATLNFAWSFDTPGLTRGSKTTDSSGNSREGLVGAMDTTENELQFFAQFAGKVYEAGRPSLVPVAPLQLPSTADLVGSGPIVIAVPPGCTAVPITLRSVDDDDDDLSTTITSVPAFGTLKSVDGATTLTASSVVTDAGRKQDKRVHFIPDAGRCASMAANSGWATDSFTYSVADAAGGSATGTVSLVPFTIPTPINKNYRFDEDVLSFMVLGKPYIRSVRSDLQQTSALNVVITALPSRGKLYQACFKAGQDGKYTAICTDPTDAANPLTEITTAGTILTNARGILLFLADTHEYGNTYTSFSYQYVDPDTTTIVSSTATVSIAITEVNDPPEGTAQASTLLSVCASSPCSQNLITLSASDNDLDASNTWTYKAGFAPHAFAKIKTFARGGKLSDVDSTGAATDILSATLAAPAIVFGYVKEIIRFSSQFSKCNAGKCFIWGGDSRVQDTGCAQANPTSTSTCKGAGCTVPFGEEIRWGDGSCSEISWQANQFVGAPDFYPGYGDTPVGWDLSHENSGREFIEVKFPTPVYVTAMEIYETYKPGAIHTISTTEDYVDDNTIACCGLDSPSTLCASNGGPYAACSKDTTWNAVWSGTAENAGEASRVLEPPVCPFAYKTDTIRLDLDTAAASGWNNWDAAKLYGSETPTPGLVKPNKALVGAENRVVYEPLPGVSGTDFFEYELTDCLNYGPATRVEFVLPVPSAPFTGGSYLALQKMENDVFTTAGSATGSFTAKLDDPPEFGTYSLFELLSGSDVDVTLNGVDGVSSAKFGSASLSAVRSTTVISSDDWSRELTVEVEKTAGSAGPWLAELWLTCQSCPSSALTYRVLVEVRTGCPPGSTLVGTVCTPCPIGKYQNNDVCVEVGPAYFAPAEGKTKDTLDGCPPYSKYLDVIEEPAASLKDRVALQDKTGATSASNCICTAGAYLTAAATDAEYKGYASDGSSCVTNQCKEGAFCVGSNDFPPIAAIGYGLLDPGSGDAPGSKAFVGCRFGGTTCKTIADSIDAAKEESIETGKKIEWCYLRRTADSAPAGAGFPAAADAGSTDPADANYLDESDPKCFCTGGTFDKPLDCCDCIGGIHPLPYSGSSEIARCGPGYLDGSALCSLCDRTGDTKYALKANVCVECGGEAGHIIVPLVLFPIILLFIQRLTANMESTEISLALLQFLGVYSGFGVRWKDSFQGFLNNFAIANVDVDVLGLACGSIDFENMWIIQAILLPLLYLAFVVLDVAFSWTMLQLAKARVGPIMFMIKKGWRPTRSFSLGSISDRYLPHGLMYLNIYYLTGVSKALVLLQCVSAGDGTSSYLEAAPSLTCWEGTHARMMGINVISILVYVIIVPFGYSYILFRRCPKEGLRSPRLFRVFGFLWSRFEDRTYWWEMVEITLRKLPLVIISIFIPGAIYKCICGILLIGALMALNYVKEPYTIYRHDLLDQAVSTAEVLLFLFGIVTEYRAEGGIDADAGWPETICLLIIGLLLTFAAFQLAMDIKLYFTNFKFNRKTAERRAKAKTALSPGIWEIHGPLVGPFIDGADAKKLEVLRNVEVMLAKIVRRKEKKTTRKKGAQKLLAHKMGSSMPQILNWMIDEPDGPKRLQKFTGDLVDHQDKQDTGGAALMDLLDDDFAQDQMLKWLFEAATQVERSSLGHLLEVVAEVVPTYAADAKEIQADDDDEEKIEQPSQSEMYKQIMKDLAEDTPCEMVILTPVETKEQSAIETKSLRGGSSRGGSSRDEDDESKFTGKIGEIVRLSVRNETFGCNDADADKILRALRAWHRPETPAGLCVTSGKPVVVDCILSDERFQGSAIAKTGVAAISQLHVPILKDGTVTGVLTLVNKVSFKTGKSGGAFDFDLDVQSALSGAMLLVESTKSKTKAKVANMLKDCTPKNRAFIAKVLARRLRQLGREKRYGKVAPA